ncbi:MAG: endonuclease MutS2 [Anaerolineales bacterium]|nr:MAG: endonuclease MutS2 [Anaerolineales bacterium]
MEIKSLKTLELPAVLEHLAGYAAFSASKEAALSLLPSSDLDEIVERQAGTREARLLLSLNADLSIGGARDIRPEVKAAQRSAVLEPHQLLDIKHTLIAARTIRRYFEKSEQRYPILGAMAQGLSVGGGLIDAINQTLDERGNVLDAASPTLAATRNQLRVVHDRLTTKLQKLISSSRVAPMLQEPLITQRDGRFVIPLRSEFKGRIKAVIHDQSSSGATLFIEPLQVVDMNNQVRELELAERDEIRRILAGLSEQVSQQGDEITVTVQALAALDLAFAKARYADVLRANEPQLLPFEPRAHSQHPGSCLRLEQARHPLLKPESVVPIDLMLDPECYALVITGPNTGGKTVTLKTAGLLVLMAECGLHIPAASGSALTAFSSVFADIGDEQSIEQSLSTFSSHISNIIHILEHVDQHSLVLLDELGAGTDPQEGSALAQALLTDFLERGVTTIVATHFSSLKAFAHMTQGVRNASVEFDLESLRPTYHLTIGLPGRSNAMAIARRLGLSESIVDQARTMVSPEDIQTDSLLDEIRVQRDIALQARKEAQETQERHKAAEIELVRRLDKMEDERRSLIESAREEARKEVAEVRSELQTLKRRLALAGQPLEAVAAIAEQLEELEAEVDEPVARSEHGELRVFTPVRLGDTVYLRSIDAKGVVTSLGEDQAEVQVGRLRVRARLHELETRHAGAAESGQEAAQGVEATRQKNLPARRVSVEFDLRGRTSEEALEQLDRQLDAAYLSGVPFLRVIHGKGTGKLRDVIRQALIGNRYVDSFEPGLASEGGDGVTVIRLKNE